MKVKIYIKKRRIFYAVALSLAVLFFFVIIGAGLVFQPEPIVLVLAPIILSIPIIRVYTTVKKGNYHGIITIDEYGVTFSTPWKQLHMGWSDIKYISIHESPHITFMGFFTKEFENRTEMLNKPYLTYWEIDLKTIDKTFLFVEYREGLLEEVKKYWENEIINEQKLH